MRNSLPLLILLAYQAAVGQVAGDGQILRGAAARSESAIGMDAKKVKGGSKVATVIAASPTFFGNQGQQFINPSAGVQMPTFYGSENPTGDAGYNTGIPTSVLNELYRKYYPGQPILGLRATSTGALATIPVLAK